MKKYIAWSVVVVALFGFNGCGSSSSSSGSIGDTDLVTLFLVDEQGYSYGGVPYLCDSMSDWELTQANGEFTFLPPDNCEFDFTGFDGNYNNDPYFDDIVRIVDYADEGKNGIPYSCESFTGSSTYADGRFDYDIDDSCLFYL
jgi:hypothetical protein